MSGEDKAAIVLDNGTCSLKIGLAGENAPRVEIPTIVGRPRYPGVMMSGSDHMFYGEEAVRKRGILVLKSPFENGVLTNWEVMEELWKYSFNNALDILNTEHSVLLTDSPSATKTDREKTAQIMFESFQISSIHISMAALLSLYSVRRTTGIVVDSGDQATFSVPIYKGKGKPIPEAILKSDIGGQELREFLHNELRENGCTLTNAEKSIVTDIKEKACHVVLDFANEMMTKKSQVCQYILPDSDGRRISVGAAQFRVPELLFTPSLSGNFKEQSGIAKMTFDSIQKCQSDLQKELYANIVLCGGSTMFPGMKERMQKELSELAPSGFEVKVEARAERKFSAWIGGSIAATCPEFKSRFCWVTKKEYEENGAQCIHK